MKKLLSILLSALMILSISAVAVYADGPQAVKTAEEFAAMAADGDYYLDADITVAASYAAPFTGTFDGKGHTVTVSAPLFAEMDGTVKNLVVEGLVDNSALTAASPAHTGAVAATINGNAVFENIKNNAVVKGMLTDYDSTYRAGAGGIAGIALKGVVVFKNCENTAEITGHAVGGILGSYDDKDKTYDAANFSVTFINCVNSGHISASDSVKTSNNGAAGGILGIGNKVGFVYFNNCKNTAKVEADKACGGPAGGMVSYIYTALTADGAEIASFKNCVNEGEIISADSQAGGITGWTRLKAEFIDCVNSGYVHSGTNASGKNNGYCAGIACRVSGDKQLISTLFRNCINTGDVNSGRDQAAGIMAYNNGGPTTYENCTNTGKISNVTNQTGKAGQAAGIQGNHGNHEVSGGAAVDTFINCVNTGEICCGTDTSKNNYAGGIAAYIYGTSTSYGVFENCVNTGVIHRIKWASQIVCYTNTPKTTAKNCVGMGSIVDDAGALENAPAVFVGYSSADIDGYAFEGNKLVEGDGTQYYCYSQTDGKAKTLLAEAPADKLTVVTAAAAKEAADALQAGATSAAGLNKTVAVGYVAPSAGGNPTTGDAAIWFAVIGAVAVLGMGVALKARKA